ncbi:hypothetical protein OEZ86_003601 [Tetradesmus obliquus]|nr:hypothetical protein OEZ86_003601 [Tetradesmus obliquus]
MSSVVLPEAEIRNTSWSSDVYEPSDDSFALVDAVKEYLLQLHSKCLLQQLPRICLEVGCGSGYVICSAALAIQCLEQQQQQQQRQQQRQQQQQQQRLVQASSPQSPAAAAAGCGGGCQFFATDINPAALQAAAQTLASHQVHGVQLVQTDLVASLIPRLAGAIDLLLFNPPYVPTPDEEVQRQGIAQAWAGGVDGRRVTDRLLAQLPDLLSPQGHAFIVTVSENRPQEIISILEAQGFAASIALSRAADEESLHILHVHRPAAAAAAAVAGASVSGNTTEAAAVLDTATG